MHAEDGLGEPGTDPGRALQSFEDVTFVGIGEPVESELGLPDDQGGGQACILAYPQP